MVAGFAACWQATAAPVAANVGFSTARAVDPPGETVRVGIWYPTRATVTEHDIGLFTQRVAPDAPVDGQALGLIVISHGNGGTLEGHYDTALALAHAGFVVAAVEHAGDSYRDQSRATHLEDRPHAVIDMMLSKWNGHTAIDPARIGIFGFSAGGFAALVSIGGVPDLTRVGPYCAGHAATFVCQLVQAHPITADQHIAPEAWRSDHRIKAAVVAAPALGFAFSHEGLAGVQAPVQIWRAGNDHILPSPDYAEPVRDRPASRSTMSCLEPTISTSWPLAPPRWRMSRR